MLTDVLIEGFKPVVSSNLIDGSNKLQHAMVAVSIEPQPKNSSNTIKSVDFSNTKYGEYQEY